MDRKRLVVGFGWGILATLAMSVLMILGMVTGLSPMPKPIPVAIAAHILGGATAKPLLIFIGIAAHLVYGGFWGALLASRTRPITIWKGIELGIFLWLVMQVTVLPFLGWDLFGSGVTPKIGIATLVLHLVYGISLGWLADRSHQMMLQPA